MIERTMDSVQNCDIYINISSSQAYISENPLKWLDFKSWLVKWIHRSMEQLCNPGLSFFNFPRTLRLFSSPEELRPSSSSCSCRSSRLHEYFRMASFTCFSRSLSCATTISSAHPISCCFNSFIVLCV
jgi:hypothetical protein